MKPIATTIEVLESRIAPAGVFTFTEADGDKVKITSTQGTTDDLASAVTVIGGHLTDIELRIFDLVTSVTVAVTVRGPTGDGFVNVDTIEASLLGNLLVKGNVGSIETTSAGSIVVKGDLTSLTADRVRTLSVNSLGKLDPVSSYCEIGNAGQFTVLRDLAGSVSFANAGQFIVLGDLAGFASFGNVGKIEIGGSLVADPAIKGSGFLSVNGKVGSVHMGGDINKGSFGNDGDHDGIGTTGNIRVDGNVIAGINVPVYVAQSVRSIHIGGSLKGVATDFGNSIFVGENAGNLHVGGDIDLASIDVYGRVGRIEVGGSILGGTGHGSGKIFTLGNATSIHVKGNIKGGTGPNSGEISIGGTVGPVFVGGSINSGGITIDGNAGNVFIGDSVGGDSPTDIGHFIAGKTGAITLGGSLLNGTIFVEDAGAVTVGGSVKGLLALQNTPSITVAKDLGHEDGRNGTIIFKKAERLLIDGDVDGGRIFIQDSVGVLTVGGNLDGGTIRFVGRSSPFGPFPTGPIAAQTIHIGGNVNNSTVLATAPTRLGYVIVGGDWNASSLVVGANLGADDAFGGTGINADNVNFGDSHDATISPSKIASISVGGTIRGTVGGTDHFGFVAGKIGAFSTAGFAVSLSNTTKDNLSISSTGDVTIHEV